jgi:hypothetical protein
MHLIVGTLLFAALGAPVAPQATDVTVAIGATTADANTYQVRLTNTTDHPVTTVVTQDLPRGATSATAPGATVGNGLIIWKPTLKAHTTTVLTSTVNAPRGPGRRVSSACTADPQTGRPLGCASTVVEQPADVVTAPWWRSPWLLLIPIVGIIVWLIWTYRHTLAIALTHTGKLRRAAPLISLAALVGILAGGFVLAKPYLSGGVAKKQALGQVGWAGEDHPAQLGTPASDGAAEFTVHRMACAQTTCNVMVTARNLTGKPLTWYRTLQHLTTATDAWTVPDAGATAAANGGADVFAQPILPGGSVVCALTFPVPKGAVPHRLELRESTGVRGVHLDLD